MRCLTSIRCQRNSGCDGASLVWWSLRSPDNAARVSLSHATQAVRFPEQVRRLNLPCPGDPYEWHNPYQSENRHNRNSLTSPLSGITAECYAPPAAGLAEPTSPPNVRTLDTPKRKAPSRLYAISRGATFGVASKWSSQQCLKVRRHVSRLMPARSATHPPMLPKEVPSTLSLQFQFCLDITLDLGFEFENCRSKWFVDWNLSPDEFKSHCKRVCGN